MMRAALKAQPTAPASAPTHRRAAEMTTWTVAVGGRTTAAGGLVADGRKA